MTQNEYDKWYRELNEAQKEATDEFFAWKEKASKGKDCYADIGITRINGKAEVALREGEYISPFRGFQMSLKQNGRILSSCNWRCEDGVEKFPLLFSTKTFKSGKIAAGILSETEQCNLRLYLDARTILNRMLSMRCLYMLGERKWAIFGRETERFRD